MVAETRFTFPTVSGLGAVIAIVVLLLVIVLFVIGKMDMLNALLIGLLALARLT
jgi:hypothetical protein